jgi:predicted transcriptional regulator
MAKDEILTARADRETIEKLDRLCEATYRTKSDMVRYLVNMEFDRVFPESKQPERIALDETAA